MGPFTMSGVKEILNLSAIRMRVPRPRLLMRSHPGFRTHKTQPSLGLVSK